jgi:ADP-heptose:LPS heptosyltransferase
MNLFRIARAAFHKLTLPNLLRSLVEKSLRKFAPLLRSTTFNFICGSLVFPRRLFRGTSGNIREARLILILKPDGIGDVMLVTGFLHSLRRQCSDARIVVAAQRLGAELLENQPCVDEVLVWDDRWQGLSLGLKPLFGLMILAFQKWYRNRPDWILIPRGGGDNVNASLYAWWSGTAHICAHERFCTDWGINRLALVNHVIPTKTGWHEMEFHRRMLTHLTLDASDVLPRLQVSERFHQEANRLWRSLDLKLPVVALGIGAGAANRRWPVEKFRQMASELTQCRPHVNLVVIGGIEDEQSGDLICAESPFKIKNAAGRLSLLGTAALLERCAVYAGNDSGPMHLAAAMGCAVVEISKHPKGANDDSHFSATRFGPIAWWSKILQPESVSSDCTQECNLPYAHCITSITPEQVGQAVSEAIEVSLERRTVCSALLNSN